MSSTTVDHHQVVDLRAVGSVGSASPEVVDLWAQATACACGDLPGMGLLAGERPNADVEVLAGAYAAVEYELARRMHAATTAGSLPLVGPGAILGARRWAQPLARRLARARGVWPPTTPPWLRHGRPGSSPPIMWMRSPAGSAPCNPRNWAR